MIISRISLLFLLSVLSIFDEVAESKATGRFNSGFDEVSLENWQQTVDDLKVATNLVSHLSGEPTVQTDKNDKSTSSDDWLGMCHNLSDDLENSWNLTVRVVESAGGVVWDMGGALYDLINCEPTLLSPIKCIFHNLQRLRKIVNPAVVKAYGFVKEGIVLVPAVIKDARKCYNF